MTDEPPPNICLNSGIKIPNRIFVGGIPYDCTSKELAQFFRHYGLVAKSKIIRDCDGISKGYGFITFSQNSDAHKVLKMGTVFFREKKLKIGPAIRRLANNDSLSIMNLQDEDDSTFNWRNSNQHIYLPSSYPAQALYSIHPGNPTFRSDVNFQNIHSLSSLICQPQLQNFQNDAYFITYHTATRNSGVSNRFTDPLSYQQMSPIGVKIAVGIAPA